MTEDEIRQLFKFVKLLVSNLCSRIEELEKDVSRLEHRTISLVRLGGS